MDLVSNIRENFSKGFFGKAMRIHCLPEEYPAWTVKGDHWVGIFVPVDHWFPFSEQFAQVGISTSRNVIVDGRPLSVVMLTCGDMYYRDAFASICSDFVDPGADGSRRRELIESPESWWSNWKLLIGNVSASIAAYDTFGELLALEYVLKNEGNASWSGAENATHDIETDQCSFEVKSTVQRYGYEVQISSVYQLNHPEDKPLWLFYIRLEPSSLGRSIDELAADIVSYGYDGSLLERALARKKLELGRPSRRLKYKVLEWKKYAVNDEFPIVNEASFKGDTLPRNIIRFNYTVDLSGISGENLL